MLKHLNEWTNELTERQFGKRAKTSRIYVMGSRDNVVQTCIRENTKSNRERERERQTDKQTDKQTDRQRQKQTDRDRQTEIERDRD